MGSAGIFGNLNQNAQMVGSAFGNALPAQVNPLQSQVSSGYSTNIVNQSPFGNQQQGYASNLGIGVGQSGMGVGQAGMGVGQAGMGVGGMNNMNQNMSAMTGMSGSLGQVSMLK